MPPDVNVVALPSASSSPFVTAPVPPPPADDGISAMAWLKEMREMRHEAQRERTVQTDAFVAALDKLGDRLDGNMATMRSELRRHLNVLMATFVLAFLVLAGLAGVGIYFKGFGVTAQSTPAAQAPAP
jgi:hypothetical protein